MSEHGRLEALVDQTCSLLLHYHGLGNAVEADPQGWFVVNPERPCLWDCNHLRAPRAATAHEIGGLLERMEERFAHLAHRQVVCDPHTPPALEATLALRGFVASSEVKLVLSGPLSPPASPPPVLEIRPATTEADWSTIRRLTRDWHLGRGAEGGPSLEPAVSDGLVDARRARLPEVRTWLASVGGEDVACVDAFAGEHGVGLVENLYTVPGQRGRGVAGALVAHAVGEVRTLGAADVLIGAAPRSGAIRLYHGLGFEPLYVERVYRRLGTGAGGR